MKKILLGILVLISQVGLTQRMAYIQTDSIVSRMPEYKKAADEVDAQIKKWNDEIDAKFKALDQLYQDYVKNESLYPDDVKKEKQDNIVETEKKAKEYREQIFGNNGELAKLQESKLKPFLDKIFASAAKVGKDNKYDYVFEKTPEINWIYTNPENDITQLVIKDLGLVK